MCLSLEQNIGNPFANLVIKVNRDSACSIHEMQRAHSDKKKFQCNLPKVSSSFQFYFKAKQLLVCF